MLLPPTIWARLSNGQAGQYLPVRFPDLYSFGGQWPTSFRANAIWHRYREEFGSEVGARKRVFPFIY